MNFETFANAGLTLFYETIRAALKVDDSRADEGAAPQFHVRDTPEWKKFAAALEMEMLKRGMTFQVIEWYPGQIKLPLGGSHQD
jgi:hypothetical protein